METKSRKKKGLLQDPVLLLTIVFVITVLLLFVLLPLFSILKGSFLDKNGVLSFDSYRALFKNKNFLTAFGNTLKLGLVVGLTSTIIGFLFAYVKQCVKSPFKKLYSIIEILPIISPPFVLAL